VPLGFLAALGILKIGGKGSRTRVVPGILVAGLSLTNVMLVAGNCLLLQHQPAPIYRDAGEVVTLDWLSEQVEPDSVVLAAYETGNYLPARVGARAFVGHGPESIRADEKKALVTRFFDSKTENGWRRQLLAQYDVDYVLWGPAERRLGDLDASQAAYLRQIYDKDGYAVFEVNR